jgi:P27 family predicted phage terminase small subunit
MPTELRVLRMSAKKAEKLAKKITPTPGPLVDPPDWLTAEQKEAWKYAIENAPRSVLKRIDKSVLAGFIVAEDTHRKASVAMAQSQLLVKSPKQELPLQNPYLPIVNRQYMLMLRGASELGFTPCSRARIDSGAPPQAVDSGWDEIASA